MLFSTAKKLTDKEIDDLIKIIHLKESRDKIVMAFIGIASSIAMKYHRSSNMDKEDLQGEALLGLVDAVNRFQAVKHNNIGGYINRYIHQYCLRYINRFYKKGNNAGELLISNDDDVVTAYDLANNVINSGLERKIIELRLKDYSDSEIAEQFGVSRQYIWSIRKTIAKRLKKCLAH